MLKYRIKPNFSKDSIRPPLVIIFAFLKKITMTGSSHFLSPNGQGYKHAALIWDHLQTTLHANIFNPIGLITGYLISKCSK